MTCKRKRAAATDAILNKLAKPQKKQKESKKEDKESRIKLVKAIKQNNNEDLLDERPLSSKNPGLDTKTSPFKLISLFKLLSKTKKDSFRKTPLGHLLDLNVGRLPSYLARIILISYKHRTQTIEIGNGSSFRVSAKNVNLTLGLPMGHKSMIEPPTGTTSEDGVNMKEKWISQFGVDHGEPVKMVELKSLILESEDYGPNFIRNLLVYIINSLITCRGNDSVCLDMLPHLQDVDKIHELNWCEYVMDKLSETREKWQPGNPFYGPILFIIVSKYFIVFVYLRFYKYCEKLQSL